MSDSHVTRIILIGLPSLDNFGTAMMGLISIQQLAARIPGPIEIQGDFLPETPLTEILDELDVDRGRVTLTRYRSRRPPPLASLAGIRHRFRVLTRNRSAAHADLMLVLGGDDLSEYYGTDVARQLRRWWMMARTTPIVLLGQTIGPFVQPRNRRAVRLTFPSFLVVSRDKWTTSYLTSEFGLRDSVVQGTDLAWSDLPLQHRQDIEADVLARFGLQPDSYATVVVSGMQVLGYYTPDRALYLQRWAETVERLLALPAMAGRRICLLAHTFGIYGDEGQNVTDVHALLSPEARDRVVAIPDRLLPTRARFILGNGLFTITGRMHPAVSTFQMGKPAITLAYSKKYEGVIGTMIGRSDLILEGNDPALWSSGEIVTSMLARADDVLARHQPLCAEIRAAVAQQKTIVAASLDQTAALARHAPG